METQGSKLQGRGWPAWGLCTGEPLGAGSAGREGKETVKTQGPLSHLLEFQH